MGSMINVRCSSCDLERQEFVGVGMMGSGQELCACNHCRRLIRKGIKWTDDGPWPTDLRCPYCRRPVHPVQTGEACPLCDGALIIDEVGLWD